MTTKKLLTQNEPKTVEQLKFTDEPIGEILSLIANDIIADDKFGRITKVTIVGGTFLKFQKQNGETPVTISFEGDYNPIQIDVELCRICDYYERNLNEPRFRIAREDC